MMKLKVPRSPFTTRLSGSAKETELRIRNIFQWKKKRPPVIAFAAAILVIALCGSIVGFTTFPPEEPSAENNNSHQIASLEGDALSPNGKYEVHLSGSTEGLPISSGGLTPPESVQIIDVQTGEVLWECDGLYEHAALWSPDSSYLALACTARTYCTVTMIETNTWTAWNVTLPDGNAIPEHTFLPDEGWGEWLVEHNFLLTVGRDDEDGQTVYRCVPDPQEGGLTGITELLIAEAPVNDPSVVLAAMASVNAEDFTNPDPNFLGLCVTAEQLAAALNAAVPNQISEEEFFSYGCDSTQIFPHWYIEHAFLESNPTGFNSKDRHFSIRCGLPENIVEVSLSEDNHRDTAYFEDRALYWLIREKDAFEERMTSLDPVAYEQFKDLLIDQMERTLARMSDNPGNFTGYELKRFTIAWTYEDKRDGGQVELYNFSFGLLTDTPETIGWAGGMALDHKLRAVNVGEPKYFAVKYLNEQVVSTAFMASDYELGQTDQDKEHINNTLDQASGNPLNQFNFVWDGTPIEFMDLTVLLPDSWNGKVGYERGSPDFIRFYHLESNHYDSYNGTLFYLSWSLGALPLDYPIENGQVLASTQNAAYILSWPTETQCPPETQEEYSTLNLADVQFVPSQKLLETSVNRFN